MSEPCRRTKIRVGVADVLGEGAEARVWIGHGPNFSRPILTLDHDEMTELVKQWNCALTGMGPIDPNLPFIEERKAR